VLHSIHSVRTKHSEGTNILVSYSTGNLLEQGLHNVAEVHDKHPMAAQDSLVPAVDQGTEVVNDAYLALLTMLLPFLALSTCKICISSKPRSETVKIAETALVAAYRAPMSSLTDLSVRVPNPKASIHLMLRSSQYLPHQRPH
jgi:hypothetical protein